MVVISLSSFLNKKKQFFVFTTCRGDFYGIVTGAELKNVQTLTFSLSANRRYTYRIIYFMADSHSFVYHICALTHCQKNLKEHVNMRNNNYSLQSPFSKLTSRSYSIQLTSVNLTAPCTKRTVSINITTTHLFNYNESTPFLCR